MAAVSEIADCRRLPAAIRVQPYHADHCFDGKAVLPAVEAMAALAASVRDGHPGVDCRAMAEARFDRFAFLPSPPAVVEAFHRLQVQGDGRVRAELITRHAGKATAITRTKTHAALVFGNLKGPLPRPGPPLTMEGFEIGADRLYGELVPFGPSFQSVVGHLVLSEAGAVAAIRHQGQFPAEGPLGAALVLDGAFHAACAWGQRYAGFVAFPVGFSRRRVLSPALAQTECRAQVIADASFNRAGGGVLRFDIRICGPDGILWEVVEGLEMRDVSRGRLSPPAWVRR